MVKAQGIYYYDRPTEHFFGCFLLLLVCFIKWCPCVIVRSLVHHVHAHGSQLVVSPLVLSSRQKVQFSDPAVTLAAEHCVCVASFCQDQRGRQRVCVVFGVFSTLTRGYVCATL